MNIAILAAGAGGMYCGSCLRDNALAAALKRAGHQVSLIPLYTPIRTDAENEAQPEIFYGGINVYLQHLSPLFRHTPRLLDWFFDRPWLLTAAGSWGAQAPPASLAGLTADVIAGDDGHARKELHRLIQFLKEHIRPQIVSLPNLMFIGLAAPLRESLGVPVVCELTGEDLFLDAMAPADRQSIRDAIRSRTKDVARFLATTAYYAGRMAEYLDLPPGRIDVVPNGLSPDYLAPPRSPRPPGREPTVGYMARVCPEKGLDRLVDAMLLLRRMPGCEHARLLAAGYLGPRDRQWFASLRARVDDSPLREAFTFLGEVERDEKIAMLDSIDLLSVPTAYPEAKGIYILEALARGVPVVQPSHGSFPELIAQTGGGLLVTPADSAALAEGLAALLRDEARRGELARAGRAAIEARFTEDHMAAAAVRIYQGLP